ncbi:MAG: diaminopimelate epimerase [Verrucomicrobia bacterium]|nr:diaminopimelate epimerase [Verrucomicrobiota bacterium]
MNFTKMNGAGNDFVVVDHRDGSLALSKESIARLCDRHRGVGADGVLAVEPPQAAADFRMRYYNADGGEADMCGNGARCFARFAARLLPGQPEALSFETPAGLIRARFSGDLVTINMSEPHGLREPADLEIDGLGTCRVHFLNTGVPHAVVYVPDVAAVDIAKAGASLRWNPAFAPQGANANFAQILSPESLVLRTFERGVEGETLACGTGVCAAALLHHMASGAPPPVSVRVRGGETLEVGFDVSGSARNVTLKGPADFVFDGEIKF